MKTDELGRLLVDTFQVDPKNTEVHVFRIRGLKALKLRDTLMQMGRISLEGHDGQEYVASIGAGFFKSNTAYLALRIEGDRLYVAVNAREGLIDQRTCKGAINELKEKLGEFIEGEE